MRISTKGRYALRLMLDLAEHQGDGCVSLRDVAQRQDISKKYLEQIVPTLSRARLPCSRTAAIRAATGWPPAGGLHRAGHSAPDRGKSCPRGLSGLRGQHLPAQRELPDSPALAGPGSCDRGLSRGCHAAGSDRPPARAQRRRLCDLKKVGGCHRQPPTL